MISKNFITLSLEQFGYLKECLKNDKIFERDSKKMQFFNSLEESVPIILRGSYDLNNKIYSLYKIYNSKIMQEIKQNEKQYLEYLYYIYFPIVEYINNLKKQNLDKPLVFGILGHQGTGKTTFANVLQILLHQLYNYKVNFLSIDDLYKTYSELEILKTNDPDYVYRGPPGTHDINLGLDVFKKFKNRQSNYILPRYDKSLNNGLGDRSDELSIKIEKPLDILIFEGWFLTVNPVTDIEISLYKNSDKSTNHYNENLIRKMNAKLEPYKELWDCIDNLINLRPENYEFSRQWRINAEHEMIRRSGKGLNNEQLNKFLDFFWNCLPPYLFFDGNSNMRADVKIIFNQERNFRFEV